MTTGTIGAPASTDSTNGPFLKGLMVPSRLRVPSGKIRTDVPFLIVAAAFARL